MVLQSFLDALYRRFELGPQQWGRDSILKQLAATEEWILTSSTNIHKVLLTFQIIIEF